MSKLTVQITCDPDALVPDVDVFADVNLIKTLLNAGQDQHVFSASMVHFDSLMQMVASTPHEVLVRSNHRGFFS